VEFLVIPSSAYRWLEEHPALAEALRRDHRMTTRQEHICEIHELNAPPPPPVTTTSSSSVAVADPPRTRPSLRERLGLRAPHRNGR
jgi:hypothetical protein